MAQKFGGKYSPNGASEPTPKDRPFDRARINPVGGRSNVLFIPPVIFVVRSIGDGAISMATSLGVAAVLLLSAWLTREGLRAEAAYHERRIAKRPAIPRKLFAAVLTGVGVAAGTFLNEPSLIGSLIYGGIGAALHLAAFGFDPMRDKGAEGIDDFQQSRVARVVDEAEDYLTAMSDAIKRANDRVLEGKVEKFQSVARDMFRTIEEDPRDLTGARKYLSVYLMGARDATVKFADIYGRSRDTAARADYEALLDDLSQNFAARTKKMLLEDRTDLTVEIDVLRDRLSREGVKVE